MFGPLYIVTDRNKTSGDLVEAIATILGSLPAGAAMVQLREKDLGARELTDLGRRMLAMTREYGCPLLINDRLDVALAIGADGVHLPEHGIDMATARRLSDPTFLLGVSTHSVAGAAKAAEAGADFIAFGPVFDTPTKRRFGPPLGTTALRAAVRSAGKTPIYAIGGLQAESGAAEVLRAGAHGVAAIRAFAGPKALAQAARLFSIFEPTARQAESPAPPPA
jgi:thiamine-phosphate pyrophosphorylase